MAGDPGSLSGLRDLAVPPPLPCWPPAPGIWIVAAGLAAILLLLLLRAMQNYRADAYRRAALAELDRIAADAAAADIAAERVFGVLKRTALVAYRRDDVASLSGAAWADFIAGTGGPAFEIGPFTRLQAHACGGGDALEARDLEKLFAQTRIWIKGHEVPAAMGSE